MKTKGNNRWTAEEDRLLRAAHQKHSGRNWIEIAKMVPQRNHQQCHQRWFRVLAPGLLRGNWTKSEDNALLKALVEYSSRHNTVDWSDIAHRVGGRSSRQCQDRWECHLDPTIKREPFTENEDALLSQYYRKYGNNWTHIAFHMKGRTREQVKKRFLTIFPNVKRTGPIGRPKKQSLKVSQEHVAPSKLPCDVLTTELSCSNAFELLAPVVLPNPCPDYQPWHEPIENNMFIQYDTDPDMYHILLEQEIIHSLKMASHKSLIAP